MDNNQLTIKSALYDPYEARFKAKRAGCPIEFNMFDINCHFPVKVKTGWIVMEIRHTDGSFTWQWKEEK